jgi:hypothetical protein
MPRAGPAGGALLGDEGLLQAARPLGALAGLGRAGHQRRQRERARERGPHCRGLARRSSEAREQRRRWTVVGRPCSSNAGTRGSCSCCVLLSDFVVAVFDLRARAKQLSLEPQH